MRYDTPIVLITNVISGHSLQHLSPPTKLSVNANITEASEQFQINVMGGVNENNFVARVRGNFTADSISLDDETSQVPVFTTIHAQGRTDFYFKGAELK